MAQTSKQWLGLGWRDIVIIIATLATIALLLWAGMRQQEQSENEPAQPALKLNSGP